MDFWGPVRSFVFHGRGSFERANPMLALLLRVVLGPSHSIVAWGDHFSKKKWIGGGDDPVRWWFLRHGACLARKSWTVEWK